MPYCFLHPPEILHNVLKLLRNLEGVAMKLFSSRIWCDVKDSLVSREGVNCCRMIELMCYFYVEIARLSHVKCTVKLYLRDEIKK